MLESGANTEVGLGTLEAGANAEVDLGSRTRCWTLALKQKSTLMLDLVDLISCIRG